MSRTPFLQQLLRQREVADLRHAGVALRAAVLQHHDAGLVDVEILVLDGRAHLLGRLEDHRATRVLQHLRRRGGRFDDSAVRREIAAQHGDACVALVWPLERRDDLVVPARGVLHVLPERLTVRGQRVLVQQAVLSQRAQHHRQSARVIEVLHEELARRHQVGHAVHATRQLVEVGERQRHAEAARDREQMDHGVRRAADGRERADRILERGACQNLREHEFLVHHPDDAPAGHARQRVAARVGRGNRGVLRQAYAERLDDRGHARRGAHRHAVAGAAVHRGLGFAKLCLRELACTHLLAHGDDVRARAHQRAAVVRGELRAARDADRRQVRGRRAHQQRRRGLVAAHQQHDAVERVRAQRFLHVHGREVAVQHGGRSHRDLAERRHGELERKAAGLEHAVAHVLGDAPEVRVAGRELRPRVANADHGPAVELIVRNTHALQPRPVVEPHFAAAAEPGLTAERLLVIWHAVSSVSTEGRNPCTWPR